MRWVKWNSAQRGSSGGGQGTARPAIFAGSVGAVLLLLCASGCSIFSGFSSGPLASVTILNQTPEKIEEATTAVFVMNGYRTVSAGTSQLTFERPGSTDDNVAYGSLMFSRRVTERVLVSMRPAGEGSTILSCNAILVENPGDSLGEDTHKIGSNRKEPYERMLSSIRARLL